LHLVEAAVVVDGRGIGLDIARLFSGEVARGVQAVDAHVKQRASAGEFLVQAILGCGDAVELERGPDGKSEAALDRLNLPDLPGANQLDGLEVLRLILAAVR